MGLLSGGPRSARPTLQNYKRTASPPGASDREDLIAGLDAVEVVLVLLAEVGEEQVRGLAAAQLVAGAVVLDRRAVEQEGAVFRAGAALGEVVHLLLVDAL